MLFAAEDAKIVKVVDFGIAGMCKGNNKEETNAGTIRYMPPELHRGESTLADTTMDIWTIGVMTWLLLFGAYPFQGKSSSEIRKSIIEQELEFPKDVLVSREARDLLRGMLNKSKARRYDMMRILTHKWFEVTETDIEEQTALQRLELVEKERKAQERRMRSVKKEMLSQKEEKKRSSKVLATSFSGVPASRASPGQRAKEQRRSIAEVRQPGSFRVAHVKKRQEELFKKVESDGSEFQANHVRKSPSRTSLDIDP